MELLKYKRGEIANSEIVKSGLREFLEEFLEVSNIFHELEPE